jgi:hypothetical protein
MSGVLAIMAFACGTAGAPIFTEDSQPLPDPNGSAVVWTSTFTLWPSGAWRKTVTGRDQRAQNRTVRVDVQEGCLDPARMKALAPSLARATFTATTPRINCRALPGERITYASPARGRKVQILAPCAEHLDDGTATADACVQAITDWAQGPDDYAPICRGES